MRRFLRQSWLSYKALFSYVDPLVYLMMMVINPILQLIFFTLMIRFAYGVQDISPWIIGNAFLLAAGSCIFIIGTLIRDEREQGTLQYVVASPANGFQVFLSRSLFHLLDILMKVIVGLLMGICFFKFQVDAAHWGMLLTAILAGMLSGFGFGLLIGSITLMMSDVHLFLNTMEQILIIMTGALFPISLLPWAAQGISLMLPLTRSIQASKMLLLPQIEGSLFYALIREELILSGVYIALGYFAFKMCLHMARKHGGIELV